MTLRATTSDEWFDHFIGRLESDPRRVRTAMSEIYRPLPNVVLRQRAYDFETERLRSTLHAS